MAGDWIKMRQDLHDDPAVVQIALLIDTEEDSVVGKLHRLWCWADKHTTDGTAPAITSKWVDRYVSKTGFADAMAKAGWISFSADGVTFPSFDIHNGQSAKVRAEASIRQRLSRKNRDEGVTGVARTSIPKPFTRHVLNRDGFTCVYCGTSSDEKTEASRKAVLSIDHIVPESRGGSASVDNLVCCCRKCNSEKNDRTPEEWGLVPTFLQEGVTYLNGVMSQKKCDKSVTREEKRREDISVAKATGDESPEKVDQVLDDKGKIFTYGVPMLVNAGSTDKAARSFLGGLAKGHGDAAVVQALRDCIRAKPIDPLTWLAGVLPPKGAAKARAGKHTGFDKLNYREGIEEDGTLA